MPYVMTKYIMCFCPYLIFIEHKSACYIGLYFKGEYNILCHVLCSVLLWTWLHKWKQVLWKLSRASPVAASSPNRPPQLCCHRGARGLLMHVQVPDACLLCCHGVALFFLVSIPCSLDPSLATLCISLRSAWLCLFQDQHKPHPQYSWH